MLNGQQAMESYKYFGEKSSHYKEFWLYPCHTVTKLFFILHIFSSCSVRYGWPPISSHVLHMQTQLLPITSCKCWLYIDISYSLCSSYTKWHHKSWSIFVQVMACNGTKPSPEPMLIVVNCTPSNKLSENWFEIQTFSFYNIHLECPLLNGHHFVQGSMCSLITPGEIGM